MDKRRLATLGVARRPASSTECRPAGRYHYASLALTAAWTAAGVAAHALAPLVAPFLLPLAPIAPLAWSWPAWTRVRWLHPSAVTVALALAGVYLLINASWSLSPASARSFVGIFFIVILALHIASRTLQAAEAPALRAMTFGLCAGLAACGAILFFEALSQQWASRLLMTHTPSLRPNPRDMSVEAGRIVFLQPYLLNRNMAVLALLFWPAALTLTGLHLPARRHTVVLLALSPAVGAILCSGHATSKIAFTGAAAMFIVASISTRLARKLAIVLWAAATLLVVPIAAVAYNSQLYRAPWLVFSAQHRIVIWGYTAEQVAKAPLFGAGIDTARPLNDPRDPAVPRAPGTNIPVSAGSHSHNGYLQVWYETGAFGVAFLLGIGLLVLRSLARASNEVQPYLYATFATGALLAASSFSLWAPWFVASFGFAVVFCVLGLQLRARSRLHPFSGP